MRLLPLIIVASLVYLAGLLPAGAQPPKETLARNPAKVVRNVKPAVVAIQVKTDGSLDAAATVSGQGAGFFISADGYMVTTDRLVNKASVVEVTANDGKKYTAKVVASDDRTDIVLIKVEGGGPFPFARLSEAVPAIGDRVLVIGNPSGLGSSVTAGVVSALGRDIGAGPYDDFIQIDAPINRGYSGGLAIDMDGNVIGVTMVTRKPEGETVNVAGFAMPAEAVRTIVSQLREHGAVTRGWIGVQIQSVTQEVADSLGLMEARGAVVALSQTDSPAAKAGIEDHDVIIAVNGKDIADVRHLARTVASLAPGAVAQLTVWHDGQQKTVELTVGTLD